MNLSVIIPVYKKEDIFLNSLKNNFKYIKKCEIIIVDDYPKSRLKTKILSLYPKVIYLKNKKNRGFGQTVNNGVKLASCKYIMLLNSDVYLIDKSYIHALNIMEKDLSVFAVSFAQKEKSGKITGANTGRFQNGLFYHKSSNPNTTKHNLWPEGGSCMMSRSYFLKLNGYDPIYKPFYWEDVDLGYRAWKRGYQILFDASIIVEHNHETTIAAYFTKKFIHYISLRNQFLFTWKNMDKENIYKHILKLPQILSKGIFNMTLILAIFDALIKLPKIIKKRKKEIMYWKLADRDIILFIKK